MTTMQVDDAVVPVIERQITMEKQRLRRKLEKYEAELAAFETAHRMPTAAFLQRYHQGALGDDEAWIRWEFVQATHASLREKLQHLDDIVYESLSAA